MSEANKPTTFLEYLQEMKDLHRPCTIRFKTVEGSISEIRTHIVEIENEGGRDMIETDAGFGIGVDQILAVNDRQPDNFC